VSSLQIWIYLSVRRKVQYQENSLRNTTKFRGNYRQASNTITEKLTTTNAKSNEQFHVAYLQNHSPAVTDKYGDNSPRDAPPKKISL